MTAVIQRHRSNPDCRAPAIFSAGCLYNPLQKHANSLQLPIALPSHCHRRCTATCHSAAMLLLVMSPSHQHRAAVYCCPHCHWVATMAKLQPCCCLLCRGVLLPMLLSNCCHGCMLCCCPHRRHVTIGWLCVVPQLLSASPLCHRWVAACHAATVVCVAVALLLWPCSHLLRCSCVAARHVAVRWLHVVPQCTATYHTMAPLLPPMPCIAATVVAGATGVTILWLPLGCACTHNLMSENKETKKSTTYY